MGTLLALVAALAAIAFAAWPLVRRQRTPERPAVEEDELLSRREAALNDIREVDFDRDLGNLTDDDYQELRDEYKRRAVDILRELNTREGQLDEEIEQAVAALRHRPAPPR